MEAFCVALLALVCVAFTFLYRHDAMQSVGRMGDLLSHQQEAEVAHVRDMSQVMRELTAYAQASFKALEGRAVEAQERAQQNERHVIAMLLSTRSGASPLPDLDDEPTPMPRPRRGHPVGNGQVNTFSTHDNAEGNG